MKYEKHLQSDWAQGVLQIIFDIEHIEQNALSLEFSFNLDYPVFVLLYTTPVPNINNPLISHVFF